MKAVVQRVTSARVCVDRKTVGEIGTGLVVLVAAHRLDEPANAAKMADRIWGLRIFNDAEGKMNLCLADLMAAGVEAGILTISNFTVYGETAKNRRPSFMDSAPYIQGEQLYDQLILELEKLCPKVECGTFGADMKVELINDGPVTVIIEA